MKVTVLSVRQGGHLGDVLDQHGGVAGLHQPHHRRFDLRLPGPADFVVVVLDRHAHLLQVQGHVAAQVVELVFGRDGMVAAVQRDVVPVPAGGAVPVGFAEFQAVGGVVDAVLEGHIVEDVELDTPAPTGCGRRCRSRAGTLRRGWRCCAGRW